MSVIGNMPPTKEVKYLEKYLGVTVLDKPWTGVIKHSMHVTLEDCEIQDLFGHHPPETEIQSMLTVLARISMDHEFVKFLEKFNVPTGRFSLVNPVMYQGLKKAGKDVSNFTESLNDRVKYRPLSYNNVYVMPSLIGVYFWIN